MTLLADRHRLYSLYAEGPDHLLRETVTILRGKLGGIHSCRRLYAFSHPSPETSSGVRWRSARIVQKIERQALAAFVIVTIHQRG